MNEIYLSYIEKSEKSEDYSFLLNYLPFERKKYIQKKKLDSDRLRSLKGDWLIREVIRRKSGINFEDIIIRTDKDLKPYPAMPSDFYFNISHSGDYIACIISDQPCGIDIEEIIDIDIDEIAPTVFNRRQIDFINSSTYAERFNRFYTLWTIKESFIKALGKGFKIDVLGLDFDLEKFKIISENKEWKKFKFGQHFFDENYKLTSCIYDCEPGKKINFI